MAKSGMLITLLSLWFFAIFAPPVITLMENEGKPLVTINLNEEEQQEQGKTSVDEKPVVQNNIFDYSLLSKLDNSIRSDFFLNRNCDPTFEIILPPPERS